jgi:hypothetical protein
MRLTEAAADRIKPKGSERFARLMVGPDAATT